jgi:hypothetical protein
MMISKGTCWRAARCCCFFSSLIRSLPALPYLGRAARQTRLTVTKIDYRSSPARAEMGARAPATAEKGGSRDTADARGGGERQACILSRDCVIGSETHSVAVVPMMCRTWVSAATQRVSEPGELRYASDERGVPKVEGGGGEKARQGSSRNSCAARACVVSQS